MTGNTCTAIPGFILSNNNLDALGLSLSNTVNSNTVINNIFTTIGSQASCTVINCQSCPTSPSICASCIANYGLYNGQCVNSTLLARIGISGQTTTTTTTTTSQSGGGTVTVSGICLQGCPVGFRCDQTSTCVPNTNIAVGTNAAGLTATQQYLLLQQQQSQLSSQTTAQQQALLLQQQQQQQQQVFTAAQQQQMLLQAQAQFQTSGSVSSGSGQSISVSNIVSGISSASFSATVTPTPQSLTFSYPSLQSAQYPSGVCMRSGTTDVWRCQINYQNQPISVEYSVILTATSNGNQWSTTFSVRPIRSNI